MPPENENIRENETNSSEMPEDKPSYTPASFEKRTLAWVGIVYMVYLIIGVTYMIATAKVLTGTAQLLLPPAAVGVAVVAIHRYRQGKIKEGRNFLAALLFLCFAAFVIGLVCGIPGLLENFGIYI